MREWLNAQAAGGYVEYDPDSGRYTLPPEQAVALTDETAPPTCPGFFQIALGVGARLAADHGGGADRATASAGTSTCTTSTRAASASSGPSYHAHLVAEWLPALDGVVEKLERGAHASPTSAAATARRRS